MSGPSPGRRLAGTALGLGRLPIAPGTWGSAGAVVLAALVFGVDGLFGGIAGAAGTPWDARTARELVIAVLALLFLWGVQLGHHAEEDYGRSDPGPFVMDEVVGQGLALLPLLPGPLSPLSLALAFVLFRVFDVLKPPPCRRLEALHGGLGIMADDVAAGLYAMVLVAVTPV